MLPGPARRSGRQPPRTTRKDPPPPLKARLDATIKALPPRPARKAARRRTRGLFQAAAPPSGSSGCAQPHGSRRWAQGGMAGIEAPDPAAIARAPPAPRADDDAPGSEASPGEVDHQPEHRSARPATTPSQPRCHGRFLPWAVAQGPGRRSRMPRFSGSTPTGVGPRTARAQPSSCDAGLRRMATSMSGSSRPSRGKRENPSQPPRRRPANDFKCEFPGDGEPPKASES